MSVFEVEGLTVSFAGESGPVRAVRGLTLSLEAGTIVALVGESGAGKSASAAAMMGLLPPNAQVGGSVRLQGRELVGLDDRSWSAIRGSGIAMVFADHANALTPVYSVGAQVVEAICTRSKMPPKQAHDQAVALLDLVGLSGPEAAYRAYPHELSGGQRQRALIAIALANDPVVLIADEPSSALDVTVQAEVMAVLDRIRRERDTAILLITHDLALAAEQADSLVVLYAGAAVETGPVSAVVAEPAMPYTMGLLRCVPTMDSDIGALPVIAAGDIAEVGCAFAPRCPMASQACRAEAPPVVTVGPGHRVVCARVEQVATSSAAQLYPTPPPVDPVPSPASEVAGSEVAGSEVVVPEAVVSVRGLHKSYRRRGRLWSGGEAISAVVGVDLELAAGHTVGVVGESGCGKTTLLREIAELARPESGTVTVLGHDVASLDRRRRRELRRRIQLVFQNPTAALDPRLPVAAILAEPLRLTGLRRPQLRSRIAELLELVGLAPELSDRFTQQLSAGQCQRVAIARALACEPQVLLLDEPVSALDASLRSGVINTLRQLQEHLGLAYLLVGHDLAVVRQLCDHLAVMQHGRIVESGPSAQVFAEPSHPHTVALLNAVPRLPRRPGADKESR